MEGFFNFYKSLFGTRFPPNTLLSVHFRCYGMFFYKQALHLAIAQHGRTQVERLADYFVCTCCIAGRSLVRLQIIWHLIVNLYDCNTSWSRIAPVWPLL